MTNSKKFAFRLVIILCKRSSVAHCVMTNSKAKAIAKHSQGLRTGDSRYGLVFHPYL